MQRLMGIDVLALKIKVSAIAIRGERHETVCVIVWTIGTSYYNFVQDVMKFWH